MTRGTLTATGGARLTTACLSLAGSDRAFFLNRQTGKTSAGSAWDTEQGLQKSEASMSEVRAEAVKKLGGHDPKTEAFEIYFTEILTPASVR